MIDLPKISDDEDLLAGLNDLIDRVNFLSKNLSLSENFNGQVIENVSFAAGEDKVIYHKLGTKPRFRVVLNQEGNGVLSDTPSGWNKYQIQIKNNGAETVSATIIILKE